MSKLLKLLEWVTVPAAATHLSVVLGEDVSEADILRLALDGRLVLSVNFVNHAHARRGRIVPFAEAPTAPGIPVPGVEPYDVILGLVLPDRERVLILDDAVTSVSGVWDLPMIGSETLDVEHQYQQLTDGPAVTLVGIEGTFVQSRDGELCQLQDHFEDNEFVDKSRLKKPWSHKNNFYPAGGLPRDSVLVVRTESLAKFQAEIADAGAGARNGTDLSTRERGTLLRMVLGMAMEGYRYDPSAARSDATAEIASDLVKCGLDVGDDTIRKWLKLAAKELLPSGRREP